MLVLISSTSNTAKIAQDEVDAHIYAGMQVPMPKIVIHHPPITIATDADKAPAINQISLWQAPTHGKR